MRAAGGCLVALALSLPGVLVVAIFSREEVARFSLQLTWAVLFSWLLYVIKSSPSPLKSEKQALKLLGGPLAMLTVLLALNIAQVLPNFFLIRVWGFVGFVLLFMFSIIATFVGQHKNPLIQKVFTATGLFFALVFSMLSLSYPFLYRIGFVCSCFCSWCNVLLNKSSDPNDFVPKSSLIRSPSSLEFEQPKPKKKIQLYSSPGSSRTLNSSLKQKQT